MKKLTERREGASAPRAASRELKASGTPGKTTRVEQLASASRPMPRTLANGPVARAGTEGAATSVERPRAEVDAGLGISGTSARGHALPYRQEMEAAFGQDFSGVGVRLGRAAEVAPIHARAAASGEELLFADAQPDRQTVAHELTHVVQHRRHGGGTGGLSQPGDPAEKEADAVAAAVTAGGAAPQVQHPAVTHAGAAEPQPVAPEAPVVGTAAGGPPGPELDATIASGLERATEPNGEGDHSHADTAKHERHDARRDERAVTTTPDVHGVKGGDAPNAASPAAERAGAAADAGDSAHRAVRTAPAAGSRAGASEAAAPAVPRRDAAGEGAATHAVVVAVHDTAGVFSSLHGVRLTELDSVMRRAAQQAATAQTTARTIVPGAPPPTTVLAPEYPPPARQRPGAAPPSPHLERRAIHHERKDQDKPGSSAAPNEERVLAGPRPQVPVAGVADPMHAHAATQSGRNRLDARFAASRNLSAGDLGVSRLDEPIHAPAPARSVAPVELPPITAPEIPEAPWSKLQPDARGRIDQAVAPGLDQVLATLDAGVQAETARAQRQVAQSEAAHDARLTADHARVGAQTTELRDTGARQVDTLRGRWHAENQAVRDRHAAHAAAAHAALESEVQETVRAGEHQCDAILTDAEHESTATRSAAGARAASIRVQAEARAAEARSRSSGIATMRSVARQDDGGGGGDGGEAEARAILEAAELEAAQQIQQAQEDIQRLITNASHLTEEQVEHRLLQITARINQLRLDLDAKVEAAIGDEFPALEAMYVQQVDVLLEDIRRNMFSVGVALIDGGAAAASDQLQLVSIIITARTERLQDTLEDAAVLSTFDDIAGGLDAFHITMTDSPLLDIAGGQRAWNDTDRQLALAQAIRLENAFRAADANGRPPGQQGLFERAGLTEPGAAFSAIMGGGNGITLYRETWFHRYSDEERQALLDANPGAYEGDLANVPSYSNERDPDNTGAITTGGGNINFYTSTGTATNDWIANASMFHIGHEFGHAFNQNMLNAASVSDQDGYDRSDAAYNSAETGLLQTETIRDANGNPIAGAGVERFTLSDATIAQYQQKYGDDWQARLQAESEAQGLRAGGYVMQNSDVFPDYLNLLPYQQNDRADSSGEWFADIFANWTNGTLADTPGGAAVDQWMDDHMQDWIEMSLDANGLLPPAPAAGPPIEVP